MCVFAGGMWRGGGGAYAVGSLSQPLPPRSPLAPLPLTSHLPHGLPPADRHWLILPSFLFYLFFYSFSFIFFPVASRNQDNKVWLLFSHSDHVIHLREPQRTYLFHLHRVIQRH